MEHRKYFDLRPKDWKSSIETGVSKMQHIKVLFDQWQNLNVCLEVHGRDIDFAKSEQFYHLTSMDAEAISVRLLSHFT